MKATLYKDFSDAYSIVDIEAGIPLKAAFGRHGVDLRNAAALVNGAVQPPEYAAREGDIVCIRFVPHNWFTDFAGGLVGMSSANPGWVNVAAFLTGGLVGWGYSAYQNYKAQEEAAEKQKDAERLQRALNSAEVRNLPDLRGASNTIATGKTQPYVIGTHLFTPYILNGGGAGSCKGYHKTAGTNGDKELYYVVLEGGFRPQILKELKADNLTIKTFPETATPQEGKFALDAATVFGSGESFVEIAQDGAAFESAALNTKVIEETPNQELLKSDSESYKDLVYTLPDNVMGANVVIQFNGLRRYNDKGEACDRSVTVIPEYSYDYADSTRAGEAVWRPFPRGFEQSVYEPQEQTGGYAAHVEHVLHRDKAKYYGNDKIPSYITSHFFGDLKKTHLYGADEFDLYDKTITVTVGSVTNSVETYEKSSGSYYLSADVSFNVTFRKNHLVTAYSNTFTFNTLKAMRFNAAVAFDFASLAERGDDGAYKPTGIPVAVRLRCETEKANNAFDTCIVKYIQSTPYDVAKSMATGKTLIAEEIIAPREAALSTLIGVCVQADEENEEKLGKLSVITSGLAPVWSASAKKWPRNAHGAFEKAATSNPASWLLEVLASGTHTPSMYDAGESGEIDLDAFGALYELCEAQGWKCDLVLTDGETKEAVIEKIAQTANATLYQSIDGLVSVVADWKTNNVIGLINEQNCVSFSYSKSNARIADGIRATYIDARSYEKNTCIIMRDGSDPEKRGSGSTLRELTLTGITDYRHAAAQCRYLMAAEKLRPKTVTAEVGKEGIFYTPYAILKVQHAALKIGLGSATIQSLVYNARGTHITGAELSEPIALTARDSYCVEIQCTASDGLPTTLVKQIRSYEGETTAIEFLAPVAATADADALPVAGAALSYGYAEIGAANPMLIIGAAPTANGYRLSLVDYNEAVYETGGIPDYAPALTTRRNASAGTGVVVQQQLAALTQQMEAQQKELVEAAQQAADLVTRGVTFTGTRYINGTAMSIEELIRYVDEAVQSASAGIQVTEERVTIKVEDAEKNAMAAISVTADAITDTVKKSYIDPMSATVTSQGNAITGLSGDVSTLSGDVSTLSGDVSTLSGDMSTLSGDMSALSGDVSALSGDVSALSGDVSALKNSPAITTYESFRTQTATSIDEIVSVNGDAAGRLGLSLELPALLDSAGYALFVAKCGAVPVQEVYAKNAKLGDDKKPVYSIRSAAAPDSVKKLWDKAIATNLLASQIDLSASQIKINADNVIIEGKTIFQAAQADATSKANAAKSYADGVAGTAQTNAQTNAQKALDAENEKIALQLGYKAAGSKTAYEVMLESAKAADAIIESGHIRTSLIEADDLISQTITMRSGGSIQSAGYRAGSTGWKINGAGNAEFANGTFRGTINATSGTFTGTVNATDGSFAGTLNQNGIKSYTMGYLYLSYRNSKLKWRSNFADKVVRLDTGRYLCLLKKLPSKINFGDFPIVKVDNLFAGDNTDTKSVHFRDAESNTSCVFGSPHYRLNCGSANMWIYHYTYRNGDWTDISGVSWVCAPNTYLYEVQEDGSWWFPPFPTIEPLESFERAVLKYWGDWDVSDADDYRYSFVVTTTDFNNDKYIDPTSGATMLITLQDIGLASIGYNQNIHG